MKVCRAMMEEKLAAKEIRYFWNSLTCSSLNRTSENSTMPVWVQYMIYNHAAGIGEPAPVEQVRAALVKSGEILEEMEKVVGELD